MLEVRASVGSLMTKLDDAGCIKYEYADDKVHGANMGPTWVLSAPDEPHVGPMKLAITICYAIIKNIIEGSGQLQMLMPPVRTYLFQHYRPYTLVNATIVE